MCKLFSLTNTQNLKIADLNKLAKTVSKNMTSERDGFGVMIKKLNGETIVRRFLKPSEVDIFKKTPKYPFAKIKSNHEGELTSFCKTSSIVLHGRTSTNDVSLLNTHPIVKHDMYLCHNGVVSDSGPKYNMITTNDTEHVVERLSKGVSHVEKHISGYYATMHYTKNDLKLTIIRDNIATLFFTYLPKLQSFAFATTSDLLESVLKSMKFEHDEIFELEDNIHLEILHDDILLQSKIKPLGRSTYADSLAHLSLGKNLDTRSTYSTYETYSDIDYIDDLTKGEMALLEELDIMADHSWSFFDGRKEISLDQFFDLPDKLKLKCVIVRPDGTIASSEDAIDGTLFESVLR